MARLKGKICNCCDKKNSKLIFFPHNCKGASELTVTKYGGELNSLGAYAHFKTNKLPIIFSLPSVVQHLAVFPAHRRENVIQSKGVKTFSSSDSALICLRVGM